MRILTFTAIAFLLTLSQAAMPASAQETHPKVVRSKPAQPADIDDVPCAAGYVFRFEALGKLSQCTLARDAIVHNAELRKGSTVALNPDGSIHHVFLPGTTMVRGRSCLGQGHGWMTHFHPKRRAEVVLAVARRGHPGRAVLAGDIPRGVLRPEARHDRVPRQRHARELHRIGRDGRRRAALRVRRAGDARRGGKGCCGALNHRRWPGR